MYFRSRQANIVFGFLLLATSLFAASMSFIAFFDLIMEPRLIALLHLLTALLLFVASTLLTVQNVLTAIDLE
jgi:hypothetical protein